MPQGTRHLSVPSDNPFVSQIQEHVLSSIMERVSNKAGLLQLGQGSSATQLSSLADGSDGVGLRAFTDLYLQSAGTTTLCPLSAP